MSIGGTYFGNRGVDLLFPHSLDLPVPYILDMAKRSIVKETSKKWDMYGDLTREILERYEKNPEETRAWLEGAGDSLFA